LEQSPPTLTVLCGSLQASILCNWRSCSHALSALLLLHPFMVLVLVNRAGCRQAHRRRARARSADLPTFSPSSLGCLFSQTWTSLDQRVRLAGRSRFARAEAQEDGRKPSPLPHLAVFPKERLSLFSPFRKILVKGILGENERQKLCSSVCDQV